MRELWPIERAVLEAAANDYPASAHRLREQIAAAQVTHFERTEGGFFSAVRVSPEAPQLKEKSPLDAATGSVGSHRMDFSVSLENGRVSLIEGYAYTGSTLDIDFETANFEVNPWSLACQLRPMKVISLNASEWRSQDDFYSAILPELGAPAWHGRNLDALGDSLGGGRINVLEPPFRVEVKGADKLPETMQHFLSKVERVFGDVRAETHKEISFELI